MAVSSTSIVPLDFLWALELVGSIQVRGAKQISGVANCYEYVLRMRRFYNSIKIR